MFLFVQKKRKIIKSISELEKNHNQPTNKNPKQTKNPNQPKQNTTPPKLTKLQTPAMLAPEYFFFVIHLLHNIFCAVL